ncbi:MAG: hypothetical protein Q4G07_04315 [Oscillospiraceae bacterium]|nr:hypothetical protein [Oscillospiraceae bacterium]
MNKQKNKQPDNCMNISSDTYSAIWAIEKLNKGQALSFYELEKLEGEDPPLYMQAQELTRRREAYFQKLLQSKEAEELHRQTTERLGRQVARAKAEGELRQLRWRLMAAQDCYRAVTQKDVPDVQKQFDPPKAEKNEPSTQTSGVPSAEQLAVLLRASASDALYSTRQMDKLLQDILGGETTQ